jgi:phosphinothricin acetyltransferase
MASRAELSTHVGVLDADEAHIDAIAAIYADAVRTSVATFDLEPPPRRHWHDLLASRETPGHIVLVALGAAEQLLGYAYSGRYMTRAAYDTTCITSVYLDETARGRGVGTALYSELFARLEDSPMRMAVAGISEPNPASTALHLRFGFERVGTFDGVGVKFERDLSVTWYQRRLTRDAL